MTSATAPPAPAPAIVRKSANWAWVIFTIFSAGLILTGALVLDKEKPAAKTKSGNGETPSKPGETAKPKSGTPVTATPAIREPFPTIIERKEWEPGIQAIKLTERVTCIELKLLEWTPAYEAAEWASRLIVYPPGGPFDWWFSTGEMLVNPENDPNSLGKLLGTLPTRTFRLRDRGASGKAVIICER